ncbi:MAG TPA: ribosome maturation factor RimM [Pyrinomonadaceae bacterium]|jgi:16S rRNA processing protein RimM|nr:ribosome maturation factor RimM [Pyrinomonadaceae bacterium]
MKQSLDELDLVIVARAVKTRGLKGELVAELLTDFPDRFADISSLIAVGPQGIRKSVELESHWLQQGRVVLKFAGYDSIERAKELVGFDFAVAEGERVELEDGYFYDWQLEGCLVESNDGVKIGTVKEVRRLGGEIDMLAVEDADGVSRLIPLVEGIVLEVDIAGRKIRIDPPQGLLEL